MIAWQEEKRDRRQRIREKHSISTGSRQFQLSTIIPFANRNGERQPEKSNLECLEIFDDFCKESTIHGVKYFGDRKRHWAEKLWWLVAFLLSIYGCGNLMLNVWNRWDRHPVIVTFAEKPTPIWQIPFPAVTICVQTKTQASVFNYTEMFRLVRGVDSGFSTHKFTDEQ